MGVNWFELFYQVIGGLAVFLFGMKELSEGLQAVASDFIRRVIGWLTSNRLLAVLVGTVVTVIVQSSSVTTVMVVGFVNAGLMSLVQAAGVILGANVGTTITGWIIALKIGKYGLVFLAAGMIPFFFQKRNLPKNLGRMSMALGFIFLGLKYMSGGFKVLTTVPDFASALTFFSAHNLPSVVACVAVGCLLTFIVQSSSAMLGITIALATTASTDGPPVIGLATAVALVLGENIGTTITAQLASIGGNINAKRAALVHTLFNVFGVGVMVILFRPYMTLIEQVVGPMFDSFSGLFKDKSNDANYVVIGFQIAAAHSLFNIVNVAVFLPFLGPITRLAERLRPDVSPASDKDRLKLLGDVAHASPELALRQAEEELGLACRVTSDLFSKTTQLLSAESFNKECASEIDHLEGVTDNIQREVTVYLTTILQMSTTPSQASRAYSIIRLTDEVESVADGCQALARHKLRLYEQKETLSQQSREELLGLFTSTESLFQEIAIRIVSDELLVEEADLLKKGRELRRRVELIRDAHLERSQNGKCDPLAGLTFSDMLTSLERIHSHSINMLNARNRSWNTSANFG